MAKKKKSGKKSADEKSGSQNASDEATAAAVEPAAVEPEAVDDDDAILYPSSDEDELVTMDECLKRGYSHEEADLIVKATLLMAKGPGGLTESNVEPSYVVICPREAGMWRIGRKFTREPTTLLVSELTAGEVAILEAILEKPGAKHLQVEKVNF